jgi:hypothetical protein
MYKLLEITLTHTQYKVERRKVKKSPIKNKSEKERVYVSSLAAKIGNKSKKFYIFYIFCMGMRRKKERGKKEILNFNENNNKSNYILVIFGTKE